MATTDRKAVIKNADMSEEMQWMKPFYHLNRTFKIIILSIIKISIFIFYVNKFSLFHSKGSE